MFCYRPLTQQQQAALDQVAHLENSGKYYNRSMLDTATLNRLPMEAFNEIDPAILDKLNPFYAVWVNGGLYLFDELSIQ